MKSRPDERVEDLRTGGKRARRALVARGTAASPDSLPPVLGESGPHESRPRMPTEGDAGRAIRSSSQPVIGDNTLHA